MRVAVIGCGSIGRRHIGNLLALGCEVSVYDIDEARERSVRSEFHLQPWPTEADAWIVATPLDHHLAWVEKAIRQRKPFFVEKPLGSLDQLPRWRELAAMTLPVNQVGYQLRFHQLVKAFQLLGPLTWAAFEVRCDMDTWPGAYYGEPLLECSHEIDLALYLGAGALSGVVTSDGRASFTLGESTVDLCWRSSKYQRTWTLDSPNGWVEAVFRSPAELGDTMYGAELTHFLDCVRDDRETDCPLADGLRVLEVCQQVEQRARHTA